MLEFASAYMKTGCRMDVIIWQFLRLYPVSGSYGMIPVLYREKGIQGFASSMQGGQRHGGSCRQWKYISLSSAVWHLRTEWGYPWQCEKESLKHLLSDSQYLCEVCTTVDKIREHDRKCRNCKYFKYCAGGCRALAIVLTGDKLGADPLQMCFSDRDIMRKLSVHCRNMRIIRKLLIIRVLIFNGNLEHIFSGMMQTADTYGVDLPGKRWL